MSVPNYVEGNVSAEFETASVVLQLKTWAQSVCYMGSDALIATPFSSAPNAIEFHSIRGALQMIMIARCKNYRCEQIALMIQVLDSGLTHRIPDDEPTNDATQVWARNPLLKALFRIQAGGFRASFFHLM